MEREAMMISYDPKVDALSISVNNGPVADSEEVAPGIIVDYDAQDRIIGVEVLSLSKRKAPLVVPDLLSQAVAQTA
jgi:uncharacterized protein YuzE